MFYALMRGVVTGMHEVTRHIRSWVYHTCTHHPDPILIAILFSIFSINKFNTCLITRLNNELDKNTLKFEFMRILATIINDCIGKLQLPASYLLLKPQILWGSTIWLLSLHILMI